MCHIYSHQPRENYETRLRSIRVNGVVRSIRLEAIYWRYIDAIAEEEGLTTGAFISDLHDEMVTRGESGNFTSLLRCSVLLYLRKHHVPLEMVTAS